MSTKRRSVYDRPAAFIAEAVRVSAIPRELLKTWGEHLGLSRTSIDSAILDLYAIEKVKLEIESGPTGEVVVWVTKA